MSHVRLWRDLPTPVQKLALKMRRPWSPFSQAGSFEIQGSQAIPWGRFLWSGTLRLELRTLPGKGLSLARKDPGSRRSSRLVSRTRDLGEMHGPDSRKSRLKDWVKNRQTPFLFNDTPQPNTLQRILHSHKRSQRELEGQPHLFQPQPLNPSILSPFSPPAILSKESDSPTCTSGLLQALLLFAHFIPLSTNST